MIWQLVKRDPAWQVALYCTALTAIAAPMLQREFMGMAAILVAICWLSCQPHARATLFQAGLPIGTHDLFLARILALLAGTWLPVAGGTLALLVAGRPAGHAALLAEIGIAVTVLILVAQSWRVRQIAGSVRFAYIPATIAWAAAMPVARYVPPSVVFAVCTPLCPLLFWNIWRRLPTTFEVLPSGVARRASHPIGAAGPAFVWWPILRTLFRPRLLGFLPMFFFLPLGGEWLPTSLFCLMPLLVVMGQMPWALALPVRRGALLAGTLLPWLGLLLSGVALSTCIARRPPIRLERSAAHKVTGIRVPLEFWHAGEARRIESPWGESCRPKTVRIAGLALYNPYDFGPYNSEPFREWQFQRAAQAVYGQKLGYAEFQIHEPTARPLMRQARLATLNLFACACWVMVMLNYAFAAAHWRTRRIFRQSQQVMAWVLAGPVLAAIVVGWLPNAPLDQQPFMALVNAGVLRVSALLPAALPLAALLAAVPVALLIWSAIRLFEGVEISAPAPAATGFGAS